MVLLRPFIYKFSADSKDWIRYGSLVLGWPGIEGGSLLRGPTALHWPTWQWALFLVSFLEGDRMKCAIYASLNVLQRLFEVFALRS